VVLLLQVEIFFVLAYGVTLTTRDHTHIEYVVILTSSVAHALRAYLVVILNKQVLLGSDHSPRLMKSTARGCCLAQAANHSHEANKP
jgi:hypothetical protein